MKKTMKRITGALCALMVMVSLVWVSAATDDADWVYDMSYVTGLEKINPNTFTNFNIIQDDYMSSSYEDVAKISPEYGWTPHYIEGRTTYSTFGLESNTDVSGLTGVPSSYIGFVLTSVDPNTAGDFGFLYSDVGTYNGKVVDLKVTVTNFIGKPSISGEKIFYSAPIPGNDNAPNFITRGLLQVDMDFTFLEHGTNIPMNIKGYFSDSDLDFFEGMIYKNSEIIQGYISNDTRLKYKNMANGTTLLYYYPDGCEYDDSRVPFVGHSDIDGTCNHNEDWDYVNGAAAFVNGIGPEPKAMFTYTFEGSTVSKSLVVNSGERGRYVISGFILYDLPLTAVEPHSFKTVSDKDEIDVTKNTLSSKDEEFTYRVSQYVPNIVSKYYYTSYVITDTVDNRLDVISAKVYNEAGNDISDLFNIVTNNNKITATAKNTSVETFYGQGYILEIKVKIKDSVEVDGSIELKNVGATIINGKETPTNEVTTKYTPETITVPATDAFIPLLISCIASLLILIGITGYYFINKRKTV